MKPFPAEPGLRSFAVLLSGILLLPLFAQISDPASAPSKAVAVEPVPFDPSGILLTPAQRQAAQWALLDALLKHSDPTSADLAVSPSSIVNAMQALWLGTRRETATELAAWFHALPETVPGESIPPAAGSPSVPDSPLGGTVTLRTASSLWIDQRFPLRPAYVELLHRRGLGLARTVNWSEPTAALDELNQWGAAATDGRIPVLLESRDLRPRTAFVLASVIQFQGSWATAFDPAATETADFVRLDGRRVPARYLTDTRPARHTDLPDGAQLLELPFSGGAHRFLALLPGKPGTAALRHLESQVAAGMPGWIAGMQERPVTIALPKFDLTGQADPEPALRELGIRHIFSEREADFSGLSNQEGLKLDVIRHQARVSIDETGAEATGATTAVVAGKEFDPSRPVFRADRPFLFFILGPGNDLLFAGRLTTP